MSAQDVSDSANTGPQLIIIETQLNHIVGLWGQDNHLLLELSQVNDAMLCLMCVNCLEEPCISVLRKKGGTEFILATVICRCELLNYFITVTCTDISLQHP
jgi:hypothetical protein